MTDEQRRRIDDHRPAVGLQWDENNPPPRTPIERPEQWTILLTSGNHGLVGAYGHTFPHAESDHERINVVDEAVVIKLRERIRKLEAAGNTNKAVLTDEQIDEIFDKTAVVDGPFRTPFARAIEAAVLSNASKAVVAEEMVRFCPHCARIGDVGPEYRDCCPDGSAARQIPRSLAEVCRSTFRLAIHGAAPAPADNPSTAGAEFYDRQHVSRVYNIARMCNHDIPDEALDEMRDVLVARLAAPALNPSDVREEP